MLVKAQVLLQALSTMLKTPRPERRKMPITLNIIRVRNVSSTVQGLTKQIGINPIEKGMIRVILNQVDWLTNELQQTERGIAVRNE